MKKSNPLSRAHLETLSSTELIKLADEYGIDIPDDLDRQFIIGDLLELGEEIEGMETVKETLVLSDEEGEVMNVNTLPQSYNETKINILLRNPVSLFVWWDLSETTIKSLRSTHGTLRLVVYFFENYDDDKPSDSFDIQISSDQREQYVIIPAGKKHVRVDLVSDCNGKTDPLSFSQVFPLPRASQVMSLKPGEKLDIPAVVELSGAAEVLRSHYNEYRQSFY